jgi:hypothetical protein
MGHLLFNHSRLSAEDGNQALSETERKAHALLQKANPDTLWGTAIEQVLATGSPGIFRKLIRELKSQMKDDEEVMTWIIGREAVSLLNEL